MAEQTSPSLVPLPVVSGIVTPGSAGEAQRGGPHGCANHTNAAVPRTIGAYRLIEQIGEGGMGVVYKAEQRTPRRVVALKVVRPMHVGPRALRRFEHEAEALGRLQHLGIARIYEAGTFDTGLGAQPFFAMELVQGKPLLDYAAEAVLDARQKLELVARVADAVHYAHQRGVIHRDLKPSNILVDEARQPKVLDFGLARLTDSDLPAVTLHTDAGQLVGTLQYMSPEQAAGDSRDVDTRTDVYSLGVIAYELLSGRPPHDVRGRSVVDAARSIRDDEPVPLGSVDRSLRGDVHTIVAKALEKDKNRRYASASDFATDIRRYLRHEPISARPPSAWYQFSRFARRNKAIAAGAAAAAMALVLGMAATTWQAVRATRAEAGARSAADEVRHALYQSRRAQARATRLAGLPGRRVESLELLARAAGDGPSLELRNEAIAAMSLLDIRPQRRWDGCPPGTIALVFDPSLRRYARSDAAGNISVRRVDNDAEIADLPGTGNPAWVVQFNHDGSKVAAKYHPRHDLTKCNIRVWDVDRRAMAADLGTVLGDAQIDFSPDGSVLAVSHKDNAVRLHEVEGGAVRAALRVATSPAFVRFDPTGKRIATVAAGDGKGYILDVDTGKATHHIAHPARVLHLAWHPGGRALAAASQDNNVYLWNVAEGQPAAQHAVLAGHRSGAAGVAFDSRGDVLMSYGWDRTLRLWDPAGAWPLLTFPGHDLRGPARFSPDGNTIAYSVLGSGLTLWEVVRPRECLRLAAPSKGGGEVRTAAVSGDGRLLAAARTGGISIWDLSTGTEVGWAGVGSMNSIAFGAGDQTLFASGQKGVRTWPITYEAGPGARVQFGKPSPIPWLAMAGTSQYADVTAARGRIAATLGGQVRVINLSGTHAPLFVAKMPQANHVAITRDGAWVAAATNHEQKYPRVTVCEVDAPDAFSGRERSVTRIPIGDGAAVAFSPDGFTLAVSSPPEYRLYGRRRYTWELLRRFTSDEFAAPDVVFAPDGSALAVATASDSVRLIRPTTGEELASFPAAAPLCFSPDGRWFVTRSSDQAIQVWDLPLIRSGLAKMRLDW